MNTVDVKELLEKGAYFGHKVARTNPRALPYTHKAQNGIYIIDLFKTKTSIENAMKALETAAASGEQMLVIATKRIIKSFLAEYCQKNNLNYMTEKWVGGFFTNFEEVHKNIKKANEHLLKQKTGELDSMIKHQRVKLEKEINKILKVYRGVLEMAKIPSVIVIVDVKKERNALSEAKKIQLQQLLEGKEGLKIIGVADTNADPNEVDFPIVVNDDSALTLEYVLTHLLNSYLEGRKQVKTEEVAPTAVEEKKAEVTKPEEKKHEEKKSEEKSAPVEKKKDKVTKVKSKK
ncbi:MAG: 30S ribosomal protein S2 [Patescibacteria group bacterium]